MTDKKAKAKLKRVQQHLKVVHGLLFELRTGAKNRDLGRLKGFYDLSRAHTGAAIRTLELVKDP